MYIKSTECTKIKCEHCTILCLVNPENVCYYKDTEEVIPMYW